MVRMGGVPVVRLFKAYCISLGRRVEVNWLRRRGERGSAKGRCLRTTTLVATLTQRDGCQGMRGARSARRKTAAWTKTSGRALKERRLELSISSKLCGLTLLKCTYLIPTQALIFLPNIDSKSLSGNLKRTCHATEQKYLGFFGLLSGFTFDRPHYVWKKS